MEPRHVLGPCYKRKVFWVDGYLLTFDFGEVKSYNPSDDTVVMDLLAIYVVHQIDAHGKPTGTCSYKTHIVATLAEGETLFEAADETGARTALAKHLESLNYSQFNDLMGGLWQWIKRQPLHWRWQLRAWRRY
jgi:hypothetical protein